MALKKKISKAEFEKLAEVLQAEYVLNGEDYILEVSGEEDTGALKRAKDREAQLRREAERKNKDLEDRLAQIEGDDARKKGDIATLEKSWQKKLDDQKSADDVKIKSLTSFAQKNLIDNVASSIAHKISNAPALIMPHIKARLQADFEGDEPKTRVLDGNGKPSAMTIEELSNEFVANKDFSAIIVGSKASGGANGGGGGAPKSFQADKNTDLSKLSPKELADKIKETKSQNQG